MHLLTIFYSRMLKHQPDVYFSVPLIIEIFLLN